jgi:hypothetical protein
MCRCMYDRHDRAAARLHLAVARLHLAVARSSLHIVFVCLMSLTPRLHIMVFRYSGRPLIIIFSTVHDFTALSDQTEACSIQLDFRRACCCSMSAEARREEARCQEGSSGEFAMQKRFLGELARSHSLHRQAGLREELRWQKHNEKLAKEHHRALVRLTRRDPNLPQAGCPISNPWWRHLPQHERAEGEGGEEPSPQHTDESLRAELQRLERICWDRNYHSWEF